MPDNHTSSQKSSSAGGVKIFLLIALMIALAFFVWKNATIEASEDPNTDRPSLAETPVPATPTPEATPEPTPESDALADFSPYAVDSTVPANLIASTGILYNGSTMDSSFTLPEAIDFGLGEDYTDVQGIVTFRGNNFRDSPTYGTASITKEKFDTETWSVTTGALQAPDGDVWTGSGWVGQPLVMTWSKEVRSHMNMYDWAKEADSLTEVIYATMDGNIYFLDIGTGAKTRDPLTLGYTFKGAGALDPRGYPIMYLGSGYNSTRGTSHVFIINLLDCSVMYEFGAADPYSLRGTLSFFDGSALVDAETDQLIYPGENGILYIIKLNTNYNEAAGTLSISPGDTVKWRYNGVRTSTGSYWLGMEDSAIIWRGHIIMSDNGGNLMCLNLNTLQLDWVQNTLDDTNCTPVLELEDGHPYVYTSTSFHAGWRAAAGGTATIPIWKIDAVTGEIVWQKDYQCYTISGVSGGVQGTLAMGKGELSDLIFVPVAMTPNSSTGVIAALNKKTGEVVWERQTQMYTWSSPIAVYDESGKGYVVFCTAGGYIYLLDGLTGTVLDSMDIGGNVEASPIIYNSTIVVGTRAQRIWGIDLT